MKHSYTKRYKYKGYTINVYTSNTAVVVCKKLKHQYVPFLNKSDCEECVDLIIKGKLTEENFAHSIWTYKELKRRIVWARTREKLFREE